MNRKLAHSYYLLHMQYCMDISKSGQNCLKLGITHSQSSSLPHQSSWFIHLHCRPPGPVIIFTLSYYSTALLFPQLIDHAMKRRVERRGASVVFLADLMVFILPLWICGPRYWWLSSAPPSRHPFPVFAGCPLTVVGHGSTLSVTSSHCTSSPHYWLQHSALPPTSLLTD